jgi:signal transduction histidine kinase
VLSLNVVAMCVVGMLGLRSSDIEIAQEYDAQMITETNVLWQLTREDIKQGDFEEFDLDSASPVLEKTQLEELQKYAQWRAFRVWKGDHIVIRSDNAASIPDIPVAAGFSSVSDGKETWRAFSLHSDDVVVETFENLRNRELLQHDIFLGIAGPLLVILPLLGLLFSLAIRFGLQGLYRLAERLSTRTPSDLALLPSGDMPRELRPLTLAVNTLLAKLESALAHESEFIDHAAHELRTPLSALKLQAQMLARSIQTTESKALLDELLASVDRTSRLVDQMLLLSRVTQQDIALEPVSLHSSAKEAVGMVAIRIVDKSINLTLDSDDGALVQAQPELLRILIGVILDNAIKYTPAYGDITIATGMIDGHATLSISDTGRGIPLSERQQVFNRFYRMADTYQSGSGLGLAIANQIAVLFGATITLETAASGYGLKAIVTFAAP